MPELPDNGKALDDGLGLHATPSVDADGEAVGVLVEHARLNKTPVSVAAYYATTDHVAGYLGDQEQDAASPTTTTTRPGLGSKICAAVFGCVERLITVARTLWGRLRAVVGAGFGFWG